MGVCVRFAGNIIGRFGSAREVTLSLDRSHCGESVVFTDEMSLGICDRIVNTFFFRGCLGDAQERDYRLKVSYYLSRQRLKFELGAKNIEWTLSDQCSPYEARGFNHRPRCLTRKGKI